MFICSILGLQMNFLPIFLYFQKKKKVVGKMGYPEKEPFSQQNGALKVIGFLREKIPEILKI